MEAVRDKKIKYGKWKKENTEEARMDGLGQLGAADSARPTWRRQLGDGTIRRRANSTRAIRRGDISAQRQ